MTRPHPEPAHVLPDLLAPGLAVVFCGTAPGIRSAMDQAYYAHPGNQFWPALHASGMTPRLFAPAEFPLLLSLQLGLTDVAKHHSGNDSALPRDAFDADALRAKIERFAPRWLAFTSKAAARAALGAVSGYGEQSQRFGGARLFVLPSPSGQARGHWSMEPWLQLGERYRQATLTRGPAR